MEELPVEMVYEIIDRCTPRTALNIVQTNHYFYDLCYKRATTIKTIDDFKEACSNGDYISLNKLENRSWEYHGIVAACKSGHTFIVDLLKRNNEYIPWNQILERICKNGNQKSVNYLLQFIQEPDFLYWAINGSCRGGHLDLSIQIYNLMLQNNLEINSNNLLRNSCIGGNKDLINFVLEFEDTDDFDIGLWGACNGGHKDIALDMIQRGANNCNIGLLGACRGGHIDLINFMIDKGANDWNSGLLGACEEDHIDAAELMLNKGATNWLQSFKMACLRNNLELIKVFINKNAVNKDILEKGFAMACRQNYTELVNYFINQKISGNQALKWVCANSDEYLMELLIKNGAGPNGGWNYGLEGACLNGDKNLALSMIKKGAGPNGGR